ncbi:uncharacterized protein LOC122854973 [Aphidius gifuensis]|uniref:uncharacterized protein LOC122854973 n=1 Tax=Aphidius gifuensis TaxID=684658 RepID=UPI001CDC78BD|nr:uncharacterized protein LOC122854973 [Aphidius gifuensis]
MVEAWNNVIKNNSYSNNKKEFPYLPTKSNNEITKDWDKPTQNSQAEVQKSWEVAVQNKKPNVIEDKTNNSANYSQQTYNRSFSQKTIAQSQQHSGIEETTQETDLEVDQILRYIVNAVCHIDKPKELLMELMPIIKKRMYPSSHNNNG